MAKKKDYSEEVVKAEYEKLTPGQQIEAYHSLGQWIHNTLERLKREANELVEQLNWEEPLTKL